MYSGSFSRVRRITLFAGHYGSGKTNIAVNYAEYLKSIGKNVIIADLDIVNPYFRTKDSTKRLAEKGIGIISPEYANTNVDLPALPSELYGVVSNRQRYAVMDIGGDDRGAYALGRFAPAILEERNFEMIYVANFCRPLTRTAEEAITVMREIEQAGGIPFSAIVNNTNLGRETDPATIEASDKKARELSKLTGLPILFTACDETMKKLPELENVFPMTLQKRYFDID